MNFFSLCEALYDFSSVKISFHVPRFSSFLPFLIVSGSMPTKYKFQFFNALFVIFGGLEMLVD
jgi:hypothetical protein